MAVVDQTSCPFFVVFMPPASGVNPHWRHGDSLERSLPLGKTVVVRSFSLERAVTGR